MFWNKKNKTSNKPITKSKVYKRINKFNESEYIKSTFTHLFHSIKVDDGWLRDTEYSEIIFKKSTAKNKNTSTNTSTNTKDKEEKLA